MTTPEPDDVLREALDDAVSDIEPTDRLGAIRARTARSSRSSRRGWYVGGAAVLTAAAVVVAVAVVSTGDGDRGVRPGTADPGPTSAGTTSATTAPGGPALVPPTGPTEVVGLYFIGDTPAGPRLFREFQQVPEFDPDGGYLEIVLDALGSPDDPDYRTAWPVEGMTAEVVDGDVRVSMPEGATEKPLELQQLQRTLAAASEVEGIDVIVVPQSGREGFVIERDDTLLAPISISDPTEAKPVAGSFTARGVADSFEANVPWRVLDAAGAAVVSGFATAEGFGRLHPWETTVDVSGLAPGTYTFEASTSDPSDGEGPGATVDTRTITVT